MSEKSVNRVCPGKLQQLCRTNTWWGPARQQLISQSWGLRFSFQVVAVTPGFRTPTRPPANPFSACSDFAPRNSDFPLRFLAFAHVPKVMQDVPPLRQRKSVLCRGSNHPETKMDSSHFMHSHNQLRDFFERRKFLVSTSGTAIHTTEKYLKIFLALSGRRMVKICIGTKDLSCIADL